MLQAKEEFDRINEERIRFRELCSHQEEELISLKSELSSFRQNHMIGKSEQDFEMDNKILQSTIQDLQSKLDEANQEGSKNREQLFKFQKENQQLKSSMQQYHDQQRLDSGHQHKMDNAISELNSLVDTKDGQIRQLQEEIASLKTSLDSTRHDLEDAIRYKHDQRSNGETRHVMVDPHKVRQDLVDNMKNFEDVKKSKKRETYFDETESSIDLASDQEPFHLDDQDHFLSGMNPVATTASHSIALSILEELRTSFNYHRIQVSSSMTTCLKQASVKASLRLLCSANSIINNKKYSGKVEQNEDIKLLPLEVFADSKILAKLVQDGTEAVNVLDDVKMLKQEKLQMQLVLQDLDNQIKVKQEQRRDKEEAIKVLSKRVDDTKHLAESTLGDLQGVMKKLQVTKESVEHYDHLIVMKKQELEDANKEFEEVNNMSQLEHKNIDNVRLRLKELHEDKNVCEIELNKIRQKFSLEESRFRNAKSIGVSEIRGLQQELVKLQEEVKSAKQDLDKRQQDLDDMDVKNEKQLKESHHEHVKVLRLIEDSKRTLTSIQDDVKSQREDLENLEKKKKSAMTQLLEIEDKMTSIQSQHDKDISDKINHTKEIEKNFRICKDNVAELENDKSMLSLVIEDLKRQQNELEKTHEHRIREMEQEVEALQISLNNLNRSLRLTTNTNDQKREETENMMVEMRSWERKLEDLKRSCREQEKAQDSSKDLLSRLNSEQEKLKKELYQDRREGEELQHQQLLIKTSLEQDSRNVDELKRQIRALQDEECEYKDRITRSKAILSQTQSNLDEIHQEVTMIRSNVERERRDLSETRSKKTMIEAELARQEEELKYVQQQIREEDKRRSENMMLTKKYSDEAARCQQELVEIQRRVMDGRKQEEDIRRRENEVVQLKERLKNEIDNLKMILTTENNNMEALRNEKALLMAECNKVKEEYRYYQKELTTLTNAVESSRAQMSHYDSVKESLQSEISRLQDTASLEIARSERISESAKDLEKRVRDLRQDLARQEAAYERVKERTADEEQRYSQNRRALHATADELSKLEASMIESNELIHAQRTKAIEEINHLDQVKQAVQKDVLVLSDSRMRKGRLNNAEQSHESAISPWGTISNRPSVSALDHHNNFISKRLDQAIALEKKGHAPTINVFDSPARLPVDDQDISREMDEAVFRSLQEAHRVNDKYLNPFTNSGSGTGSLHHSPTNIDENENVTNRKTSQGATNLESAAVKTVPSNVKSDDNDVLDLRAEMQKLREQTSAILS